MKACLVGTLVVGLLPLSLLAACGSPAGTGGTTSSSSSTGGASSSSSSTSTTTGTGGTAGGTCGVAPTKSGAECILPATITASMTLGSECQPWHIAAAGTQVGDASSPVLTIAPCVTIEVDPGGSLVVAGPAGPGGLVAVGTVKQPITFTSSAAIPAAGDWGPVAVLDQAVYPLTTLGFVDFEYGGGNFGNVGPQGSLVVDDTKGRLILLHDLILTNNLVDGIHLMGAGATTGVGFAVGSGNLTIKDWGKGHSPILLGLGDAAATVPTTLTTGASGHDGQVELASGITVDVTQTWPAIPVPYLLDSYLNILGVGTSSATLTIAAPNVIQSLAAGQINVDPDGTDQGYLIANGTGGNIVFTTSSANPSPGDWEGIFFQVGPGGQGASSVTGCTIEYAAATQHTGGCQVPASVVVRNDTAGTVVGPTLSGCIIQDYAATDYGIDVDATVTNGASYSSNTFDGANVGDVCDM